MKKSDSFTLSALIFFVLCIIALATNCVIIGAILFILSFISCPVVGFFADKEREEEKSVLFEAYKNMRNDILVDNRYGNLPVSGTEKWYDYRSRIIEADKGYEKAYPYVLKCTLVSLFEELTRKPEPLVDQNPKT